MTRGSPTPGTHPPDRPSHLRPSPRRSRSRGSRRARRSPPRRPRPRRCRCRPKAGRTAPVWIVGVIVLILVGLVGYFLSAIGPAASIIGMLLAFVPLGGRPVRHPASSIAGSPSRADCSSWPSRGARWPPSASRSASTCSSAWSWASDDSLMRDAFSAVVQAPIVEEFAKGLGVLPDLRDRPSRVRRSGRRRRLRRAHRRGLRLHREHPVLRDQLHRGRRRRRRRPPSSSAASSRRSRT